MNGNILGWLAFVAVTILFGWITWRAWRIKNALLKWAGVILAGLLTLILALATVVIGRGLYILYMPLTEPVVAPPKAPTADYGAYIVSYNDCRDCHGENLDGKPSGPVKPGPNLRVVQGWTQEQFIATLRTGIDPGGHALQPPMFWKAYGRMDDEELVALYLYLKNLPPVTAQK